MIFKAIQNDATGAITSIGLFGKTFDQLKASLLGFGSNVKNNGLLETLKVMFNTSYIDTNAIQKYNLLISQNVDAQTALQQASMGTNQATVKLMQSANGAAVSTKALTIAQQSNTIAAKAATIAWTGLQVAMNIGAILLIAKGIQLLLKAIDSYVHRVENAKEALENFNSELADKRNTYKSHTQLVDKVSESYDALAEKVNTDTNYNLGLNEDEYANFIDMNNQLADAFPTLVKGYDESGNAIIDFGNDCASTTEKLDKLLEAERKAMNIEVASALPDYLKETNVVIKDYNKDIAEQEAKIEHLKKTQKLINDINSEGLNLFEQQTFSQESLGVEQYTEFYNLMTKSASEFVNTLTQAEKMNLGNLSVSTNDLVRSDGQNIWLDFFTLTPEMQDRLKTIIHDNVSTLSDTINDELFDAQNALKDAELSKEQSWNAFTDNLVSGMNSKASFQALNAAGQQLATTIVKSLDSGVASEMDENDPYEYVRKNILSKFKGLSDTELSSLNAAINNFNNIDMSTLTITGQEEARQALIDAILSIIPGKKGEDLVVSLGLRIETDTQKAYTDFMSDVDSKYGEGYSEKWNSSIQFYLNKYNINSEEELNALRKFFNETGNLANAFNLYAASIEKTADATDDLTNATQKFTKLQMIDTINSMSDGFDILDNIYADVYDGETFDFTNLDSSKFEEAFSGLEKEYTNFIETISASPTDIDACQNAFDELTTAFVKQKGILSGVSEENKQLTIDMLENMGVINAEEVVLDVLAQKERNLAVETEKAALASQNLAMNSWDTINALVNEEGASDIAQIAMAQLALEKLKVNNITISTSKDIQQIINLANTALAGTEALAQLAKAKNVLAAVESAGSRERAGVSEKAFLEAQNIVKQLSEGTYDFQFNLIDTSKLLTQFGGASETAAAKQKNLEDATKSATDALEKEKQALEDLKSEYDELYDAIQWYFDKQIDDIDDKIDAINKENEALKKQKDNLDDILAAIENNYDYEISLIQDKIDKLQDANDEEEKAIALEEAKRKLQEARSRKTILLYQKGKGFTYVQDQKAIKESEEELEKLQEEAVIDELQDQIDKLEELKNKWSEIPEAYEKAMQELAAKKYFGDDWKNITLNPSDSLLNKFEGKYTGIQSTIDKNESKIEGLEAEKERIEELKELWEEAKNAYQYSQYEAKLSSFFGSDYEYQLLHNSAGWRRKFADEYSSICAQIEALEERIKASNESTASSTEASADRVAGAAKKVGESAKGIKFEIDTDVLTTAKEKLEQLDFQISLGQQGLHGVRDAVAEFINNYEKADGCTTLTKELTDSVEVLKGMYEGTGSSMEGAMSKVSSDIETFKVQSQTMSQNLTDVDEKLQSISSSESQVESNVNAELSEVDQTILNLKKNIDDLKLALQELETFKANLDTLVTTQTLDTSVLVADTMARVVEIQTAVSTLFVSLTTLTTALETLDGQMQTLDSYTLNNLIMALGQGGQEGGGSGLFAAIQNIITLLGNEETGLLYLLTLLNNSDLSTIIAAFNGEAGLLTAINQVASAIYIPDDSDGISLYSIINKLIETIPTISTVRSSFSELVGTLAVCNSQVSALQKAIDELPIEKTITIKVVQEGTLPDLGGTGTAFAFGAGTAKFNSIKSGHAYAKGTGQWGLDKDHPNSLIGELKPEILLRDGEYHLIEDPTIMDLKKDDIIFNGDQTEDILKHGNRSNISRLEKLSKSAMQTMFGKSFGNGTASQMRLFELLQSGLPNSFYAGQAHIDAIKPLKASHGLYNKQELAVTIGDIYVQGVDNANSLADDIIKNLPNIMLQKLNKH